MASDEENEAFSFQNAEQMQGLLALVATDENGLYKTLCYNSMCVILFAGVSRNSFEQLIRIHSADDTDAETWKLRSIIWKSFLVYNGVFKLGPVKHIPPLTMFKYADQPFPVTLTTVRPLEQEEDSEGFADAKNAEILKKKKPWAYLEINIEYLSLEAGHSNDMFVGDSNALVMAHWIHIVSVAVAESLTESVGKTFVPKPIDSLLDKLFYRQLDIHDLIRTRVEKDEMEDVVQQLLGMGFVVFQRKTTKNGASSVVLFGGFATPEGQNGPLWIEVQQDLGAGAKNTHMEYEIARMVRSDRYQSFLENDPNFEELQVPRTSTEEDEAILEYICQFVDL